MQIPITDSTQIKTLLPHREPMIMVDSLLEFSEGKAIVGFTIRKNIIFMYDNACSETGLIEHMAQAAALYIGYKNYSENKATKEGFIAAIKHFLINKLPQINEILKTEVVIVHAIMHMCTVKVSTFIDQVLIAQAEMTTVQKEDE